MVSCHSRNAVLALRADFLSVVMPGLTRASIVFRKKLDCRIKSGDDG
jgi:hypothetical protein